MKMAKADIGPHVPRVAIAPPLRCYQRVEGSPGVVCGELAAWARPGVHWFSIEYFCDRHRSELDLAIAPEHVFRRVRFNADLLLAGASESAPIAHLEALARLSRALEAAGAILEVNSVTSHVVRSSPPPAPGGAFSGSGSGG